MKTPSQRLMQYFKYQHLPGHLQEVSRECCQFAEEVEAMLPDGPEKTAGMRKLLEAKDCFVRAQLEALPDRE